MAKRKTVLTGWDVSPKPDVVDHVGVVPRHDQQPAARTIVQQTLYLPAAVHEQLRGMAFHRRVKMHTIVMEGLDAIFRESGLKSIAELSVK